MQWLCCHFCAAFCLPRPSVLFLCCILYIFFVTWFSHYPFSSENQEQGEETAMRLMSSPQTTIRWCTEHSPRTVVLFISNSPGCFRAYWFDLSGFSRILICLQTNTLGSKICSTYAENLLNCFCPLHAFTHEYF